MKRSRFTEELIIGILREQEAGAKPPTCAAGVVTLTAAKRIKADLDAGLAQAAMLAADFHSAMALRRCR